MDESRAWSLVSRVAFRFAFCYVALYATYCFDHSAQLIALHFSAADFLPFPTPLLHEIVPWFAHVLHLGPEIVVFSNGSGDTKYDWVLVLFDVTLAAAVTAVWSIVDRKRVSYDRLYSWLLLGVRVLLASELMIYGLDKVVPAQFGPLTLTRMILPFGSLSPTSVLWASMAASTGYTIFAGSLELAAGILLLIPRLWTVGALIAAASMTNVFALNVFYDVPVKLLSLHLLLLALFLLVPELRRLTNVLIFNRAVSPAPAFALSGNPVVTRSVLAAIWVFGAAYAGIVLVVVLGFYHERLASIDPSTPFYGIWSVDEFTASDPRFADVALGRWQYLVFESPGSLVVVSDAEVQHDTLRPDPERHTIVMTARGRNWVADVDIRKSGTRRLVMQGKLDGMPFRLSAHPIDPSRLTLSDRSINLISEYPR